jgi:L-cystine transport system ATP-binding protein
MNYIKMKLPITKVKEGKPHDIFTNPKEERTKQFLERILPKWNYNI